MAARGHHVDIFTTDQDGPHARMNVPTDRAVRKGDVNINYFHADTLRGWPCVSFALWRALRDKIPNYDIVHTHSLYLFPEMMAGLFCRKYSVPYVVRPAGTLDPYIFRHHRYRKAVFETFYEKRNLRKAAALHFTTEEEMQLARQVIEFGEGIVVPLGLFENEFNALPAPGTFRQAFPEIGDKHIILFLGRINFKKGLDLLIPAFAGLARKRDDVHLAIVGPDDEGFGAKVRAWIRDEGIASAVTFTGLLQGELRAAAMRDSEMFVLPSYSENFGIAVIEAMACGLPVVISDKVNIWREVKAVNAGMTTECDIEAVAEAMDGLLSDRENAARMGQNGKLLVAERYNWPSIARMLEAAYTSLLPSAA